MKELDDNSRLAINFHTIEFDAQFQKQDYSISDVENIIENIKVNAMSIDHNVRFQTIAKHKVIMQSPIFGEYEETGKVDTFTNFLKSRGYK
ncbi:hypothetical protein [Myroides sp.]|uniref:hypothetical protein n=1 Tax=Myroides sp. TaxID=1874736 RepID=UPI0028ADA8FA|nr:hypothetical protein [Myroides sp.]